METPKRIFDFFYYQQEKYPQKISLSIKENGKWRNYSTQEVLDLGNLMSRALMASGIKKGDTIAMVSNNRPEWHILDLAISQIGAVNVPIYPTITADEYAFVMNHAECKMAFASDKELFDKVMKAKEKVPTLKEVFTFDNVSGARHYTEFMKRGEGIDKSEVEKISQTIDEKELATLIYTSGTTGNPKGVMLSHYNIVQNVLACKERLPVDENTHSLSFLPLCHVYERTVCYLYIYAGVSVYYAESIDTLGDDLREVKPEVFTAVPRLLEKVYEKIIAKGSSLSGIKKALFFWAVRLGFKYDLARPNRPWYNFKLKIAKKLIFDKWKEAIGGNVEAIASGSAPLQPRLIKIFMAAGIPVVEGYGQTETSPVVSVNCEKDNGIMIGTVGRVISGVEIRIADDGEILIKGHCVMMGYYKNEAKTKEVLEPDGWLHTGDIGEIVGDGFLKITDRKKEIFKTSGGKYIAPQVLENKFKESRFINQMMVIGEGQKMPAAFIVPDFEYLKNWCKIKNISYASNEEMIKGEQIIARIQEEIDKYNEFFAHHERIKVFRLIAKDWSVDSGELTPTLKLKRKIVLKNNQALFDDIYHEKI